MEPRKGRRIALVFALLAVLMAGGLSIALTGVIAPRGPSPDDDEWGMRTNVAPPDDGVVETSDMSEPGFQGEIPEDEFESVGEVEEGFPPPRSAPRRRRLS